MADVWPLHGDGQRFENAGQVTASTALTVLTAPGSNNTKGAWVQLIAATSYDAGGFILNLEHSASAAFYLVDIGVGVAASEQVILANFFVNYVNFSRNSQLVYIPIAIPAGVRVAARAQSSNAALTDIKAAVTLVGSGFLGGSPFGISETWGATLADSGGIQVVPGVSNAKGSYAEIVASSAQWTSSLIVCIGNSAADFALAAQSYMIDIATGAGGSETVIIPNLLVDANDDDDVFRPAVFGPFPCSIPAASRVACRAQTSGGSADNIDVVIVAFSL